MNKKALTIILPTLILASLVGCNGGNNPTPSPEPIETYPIDFEFAHSDDENIDVDLGSTRQVSIAFKQSSYINNVKSIKWNIESTSNEDYIQIDGKVDKTYCKFKAIKETPELTPVGLTVTVTNKDVTIVKQKTCFITIENFTNKPMFYYESWYSYLRDDAIASGSSFTFTATRDATHNFTYFGMSNYKGTTPYFSIGHGDTSKTVSVTSISIDDGESARELTYGSGNEYWKYGGSDDLIIVKSSLFPAGAKIIIKCTINKNLDAGLWAYIGSY